MVSRFRKTLRTVLWRKKVNRTEGFLDKPLAVVTLRQLLEVLEERREGQVELIRALVDIERYICLLELNLDKPLKDRWQIVKDLRESFDRVPGVPGVLRGRDG